ncbi:tetratricopeptide repeat protein [Flavobacterium ajazii]|uniref:tetratricopeptide repeat protein n=1 Tax=Flavobacterium ajazii TaxID=2692318 RepID=UPI0013D61B2E|nr:tetratricopeptide repeat protein [Flavobacterium ajazii]
MKNYSSYKKTEEVYFGGDLAFPVAVIVFAACITYGLLYFFGVAIGVIFNVIISWCAYFYLYYFGKSSTAITFDFLIGVVLISGLFLFVDYGVYTLVVYQKTGVFNKLYFQLWLSVLVGIPFLYYAFLYGRYYIEEKSMADNYLKVSLKIHHDRELLTYIDVIQFANTSKRTMSDIKLEKPLCFYSEKELNKMNESDRIYYLEKDIFSSMIHMPFNTDFLFMSWYSIIEDKYYDLELPFPFDKLVIEQEKYPTNVSAVLRGKKTKRLNLHILANGGIRLFNEDIILIDLPSGIPNDVTEEFRNEKIKLHRNSHEYYNDPVVFSGLIEKIKSSNGIEERFLIQNKKISWNINISGLKGNNYLDVFDVAFNEYKSELVELEITALRFLPKKLGIVYRGNYLYNWLMLHINTRKLYHSILQLADRDEETSVKFDLVFENLSKTDLKFRIQVNDKSLLFNDWKIEIKKDRKQDMEDHLLDIDEDQQKRTLYKEGWDLVFDKKYDLAQEKCNTIKTIDPKYGFAYFLEVRILWYKEGFEACFAKKDYFIAKTQHEPAALAHMYNNYGCLYDQQSRYDESLSYFEKAILSNPKDGMYVCNLAEIYCKLNNPKKALQAAEKSKELGHESSTLNAILESKGIHYL